MIENNKLIAEFLGMQKTDLGWFDNEEVFSDTERDNTFDDLKFHRDWNWLMLVVNEIEKTKLGSLEIQSKNLVLLQYNQKTDKYYNSTLIENLYNACVEFIKWYNENLTSQIMKEFSLMKNGTEHGVIRAKNKKEAENLVNATYGHGSSYYVLENE